MVSKHKNISMDILIVHWNKKEALKLTDYFLTDNMDVAIEFKNSSSVIAKIKELRPSIVLIYLTRNASQGRKTATLIKSDEEINDIPFVFVDGNKKEVEKTRKQFEEIIFTTSQNLDKTLKMYLRL